MSSITFIYKDGTQKTVEAPLGLTLMEIAVKNAIPQIEGACGGSLACATCHMYVHPDWADRARAASSDRREEEEDMLDLAFDVRDTSRLGCQITMKPELDGLILALPGSKPGWE